MAATPKTPRAPRGSGGGRPGRGKLSPWLAPTPGKRWTELFFLAYSPSWIIWCLCILVPFKIYEVGRSWVEGRLLPAGEQGAICCSNTWLGRERTWPMAHESHPRLQLHLSDRAAPLSLATFCCSAWASGATCPWA